MGLLQWITPGDVIENDILFYDDRYDVQYTLNSAGISSFDDDDKIDGVNKIFHEVELLGDMRTDLIKVDGGYDIKPGAEKVENSDLVQLLSCYINQQSFQHFLGDVSKDDANNDAPDNELDGSTKQNILEEALFGNVLGFDIFVESRFLILDMKIG